MPLNPIKFEVPVGAVGVLYVPEEDELAFIPLSHGVSFFMESGAVMHTRYYSVAGAPLREILMPNGRVYIAEDRSTPLLRWVDAQRAAR